MIPSCHIESPPDVVLFSYIRGDFVYCPFLLVRFKSTGELTVGVGEETRLLWDLQCVLEKELEPVDEAVTKRLV